MHILIGLVVGLTITTVLLIGWLHGNLFACVFLTLPPTAYLLIACLQQTSGGNQFYPGWVLACVGLICIIWTPRRMRLRAMAYPIYQQPPRYPPLKIVMAGQLAPFIKALGAVVAVGAGVTLVLMPLFPI